MDVPTGAFLSDVWGTAGFVAVVGDGGTAWVRRASVWEATPTPVDGLLLALFGRAPADLYACGRDGATARSFTSMEIAGNRSNRPRN
jgi:hypothetical protein